MFDLNIVLRGSFILIGTISILHFTNYINPTQLNHTKESFVMDYGDDFKIKLISNEEYGKGEVRSDEEQNLEAFITFNQKTVTLSGVDVVSMDELIMGKKALEFEFLLKNNLESSIKSYFELGDITLSLSDDPLFWRLSNMNGVWGTGNTIDDNIKIRNLLPDEITELMGYETLKVDKNNNLKGKVYIKNKSICKNASEIINLSSLNLEEQLNKAISQNGVKYSELQIMANYNFKIILQTINHGNGSKLVKSNTNENEDLIIQGKLTLMKTLSVFSDKK